MSAYQPEASRAEHGRVGLILVAAGQGTRLGAGRPKALVPLGRDGAAEPIVAHALRGVLRCRAVTDVVVVGPGDAELLAELESVVEAVAGRVGRARVVVVPGGEERADSVERGLRALPGDVRLVLVHDAARALTPVEVFDRVVDAVRRGHPAVTPALPVVDTVKEVATGPAGEETVVATVDRSSLRAVQTPQGFLRETLARAHAEWGSGTGGGHGGTATGTGGSAAATDDCGMVEASGGRVTVVAGSPRALKITTAHDLEVAAAWLREP